MTRIRRSVGVGVTRYSILITKRTEARLDELAKNFDAGFQIDVNSTNVGNAAMVRLALRFESNDFPKLEIETKWGDGLRDILRTFRFDDSARKVFDALEDDPETKAAYDDEPTFKVRRFRGAALELAVQQYYREIIGPDSDAIQALPASFPKSDVEPPNDEGMNDE